ncbi:MAG: flagellar basal body P-ring protein FlgI, partial [Phycisphaerales bacterium]
MKRPLLVALALVASALPLACSGPPKKAKTAEPVLRDVPAVLRGTVGTEATIRGVEPILVSGFGIVVGLNGTGGGTLPVGIQATMERELARNGIGRGGILNEGPLAGKTPKQVLRDPNVAVVVVEGVIPPGAPKGATFDVRVRALPESGVTSLEGGRLWTTELRLGPATRFGAMRTRKIGEVEGAIYINPFADPGMAGRISSVPDPAPAPDEAPAIVPAANEERPETDDPALTQTDPADEGTDLNVPPPTPAPTMGDGITRTVGRVIAGGTVTQPLRLELLLDNPSHARAAQIKDAINSRFPPGPADDGAIARGRNDSSIAVRVPAAYADGAAEFVQLLRYLPVDQAYPQEYAKRYAEELPRQPALADALSWALQACGKPAIPFLAPLYESPELLPRLAALRAGAKLGDARATLPLRNIALDRSRPINFRAETIQLLGEMRSGFDPQTTVALRSLLDAPELAIRVAAYESLQKRGDASVVRVAVDRKFTIDCVQATDELIYVAQEGSPRIVLFGRDMRLAVPILASAWANRLMIRSDESTLAGAPQLYYQDYRTGAVTRGTAPAQVRDLAKLLGHTPTPESPSPGLGLTYSEVVGALYEIQKQGGVAGAFATEQERLIARIGQASEAALVDERPENDEQATATPMKALISET